MHLVGFIIRIHNVTRLYVAFIDRGKNKIQWLRENPFVDNNKCRTWYEITVLINGTYCTQKETSHFIQSKSVD